MHPPSKPVPRIVPSPVQGAREKLPVRRGTASRAWERWAPLLAVVALALLAAGALALDQARPRQPTFLDLRWNAPVRTWWDGELVWLARRLLGAQLAVCLAACGLWLKSSFRRADPAAWVLALCGISGAVCLLLSFRA